MTWVGKKVSEHNLSEKSVLEVGSRNVNGSVRKFFSGPYVGLDMEEGDGVDLVNSSAKIPFSKGKFDVVVSTEVVEHDPTFWLSMQEVGRVMRKGGWLLLTTRGIGFQYHAYPMDYWRFTHDGMRELLQIAGLDEVELTEDPLEGHPGWLMVGRKP